MEARMKLFGHPIHQMTIILPLGLLAGAWLFDIGYYITQSPTIGKIAFYNTGLGLVAGLIVAVFGFLDWRGIPGGTRAKRVGAWHATANIAVLLLFAISWTFRYMVPEHLPTMLAFCFATAGVLLAGFSGWLGGELVNRYTVGVKDGAGLDASGPFMRSAAGTKSPHR